MAFEGFCRVLLGKFLFQKAKQFRATLAHLGLEAAGGKGGHAAISLEAERRVVRAKIARAGIAGGAHAHKARQVGIEVATILGDYRANLRVWRTLALLEASVHVINAIRVAG